MREVNPDRGLAFLAGRGKVEAVKVAHIISNLGGGGAETSLFRLVRALPRAEYRQTVISLSKGGVYPDRLRALGAEVIELDLRPRLGSFQDLRTLGRALERNQPDIVQGWMYHGNVLATLYQPIAARGAKVCWNVRQSSASLKDDKPLTRALIVAGGPLSRFCSRIIYNSTLSAEQHEARGYAEAKRRIIHNGIDTEEFKPDAASRERLRDLFKLPTDAVILGRFGRNTVMKDNRTLLRAFGLLAAKDRRCHLVAIGRGMSNDDPELARWASESGAAERVHFSGGHMELPALMPGFDVNVSSSGASEGFPNVVAEGMACAVPTVATDIGESRLIIGDPLRIVQPRDPAALAGAIGAVLALSAEERLAMATRDRARIGEQFSMAAMVAAYVEAWRGCLL